MCNKMATTCSTPVLLGLHDSPCPNKQLSPYENKIGGYPDFYPSCSLVSPPCCGYCGADQVLLVQVYCPLEGSVYHRLLHVFCCSQQKCWSNGETWCVLRSQLLDESSHSPVGKGSSEKTVQRSSASDWFEGADGWGSDSEEDSSSATTIIGKVPQDSPPPVCSSGLVQQMADLNVKPDNLPTTGELPQTPIPSYKGGLYFPPYYVSVIEEPKEHTCTQSEVKTLLQKYPEACCPDAVLDIDQAKSLTAVSSAREICEKSRVQSRKSDGDMPTAPKGSGGSERYEKAVASHGDRTFQRFQKQLYKCPQQILRYHRNGNPVFITDKQLFQPPKTTIKCRHCNSNCVFEFQLMPPLVYLLQKAITVSRHKDDTVRQMAEDRDIDDDDGCLQKSVEFGTVVVFSCAASCWKEGEGEFKREHVLVQPDSESSLCDKFVK